MKSFFSVLWRITRWLVFSVGIVAVVAIIALVSAVSLGGGGPKLADRNYLMVNWSGGISETAGFDGLAALTGQPPLSVSNVVGLIDRAAGDPRIQSLVMDMSGIQISFAQAEEFAPAIQRFRATGKKAYAYAQSYDIRRYRLAVEFDEVWLLRSGTFDGSGPYFEAPFARNLLDTLGIEPQFEKRKDFKNALDSALETRMPSAMRDAMTALARDMDDAALQAISQARQIGIDTLPAKLQASLLNPAAALDQGLVDRLAYPHDLDQTLDLPSVSIKKYAALSAPSTGADIFAQSGDTPKRVALITASGAITASRQGGGFSQDGIAADRLTSDILTASEDDSIDAILLRIDSPGGEYGASDMVRDALARSNKPVVVSMGSVAGSGGYLIAIGGDRIIAQPSTITGSIGVIGGKFAAQRAFDKVGVNWEGIAIRDNTGLRSIKPFNTEQRAVFAATIDTIYSEFVGAVATARSLSPEAAEAAAQGRVWSGKQALALGLVDRLGGLSEARLELAALLELDDPDNLHLIPYPKQNTVQQVLDALGNTPMILTEIGHIADGSRQLRTRPEAQVLIQQIMQQPGAAYMTTPVFK